MSSHLPWPDHLLRPHPLLELLLRDVAERDGRLLEGGAFAMRLLRDRGGLVVADVRIERRDEHQRALKQLTDALAVGLDATRAVLIEALHSVGQQPDALQHVVDDHRAEYVELEVSG